MKKTLTALGLLLTLFTSSALAKVTISGDLRYRYASNGLYEITDAQAKAYETIYENTTNNNQAATDLVTAFGGLDAYKKLTNTAKAASFTYYRNIFRSTFLPAYYGYSNGTANVRNGNSADNRFRFNLKLKTEEGLEARLRLRADNGFYDSNSSANRFRIDQAYLKARIPQIPGLALKAGSFRTYVSPKHVFADLMAYDKALEASYKTNNFKVYYRAYENGSPATATSASHNLEYQSDIGLEASFQGIKLGAFLRSDNTLTTTTNEKRSIFYIDGQYQEFKIAAEYSAEEGTDKDSWYASAFMNISGYDIGGFYLNLGKNAQVGADFNPLGISVLGTTAGAYRTPILRLQNLGSTVETHPLYSTETPHAYGAQVKAHYQGFNFQLSAGLLELNQGKRPTKVGSLNTKLSGTEDDLFYDLVVDYKIGKVATLRASYGSVLGITSVGGQVDFKF